MKPLAIVVLISGNGSNLQAIIDAIAQTKLNAVIKAVVSNKADAFGLERAKQAGISTEILTRKSAENREAYDIRLHALLETYQPELIVLAGFMRILSAEFVHHYSGKIINIHPALLPKYPGLDTHAQVIANGDTEHGISIHYVTDVLDGGPVICQARFTVNPEDNAQSLPLRIHKLEHKAYPLVINWLANAQLKLDENTVHLDDCPLNAHGYQLSELELG